MPSLRNRSAIAMLADISPPGLPRRSMMSAPSRPGSSTTSPSITPLNSSAVVWLNCETRM